MTSSALLHNSVKLDGQVANAVAIAASANDSIVFLSHLLSTSFTSPTDSDTLYSTIYTLPIKTKYYSADLSLIPIPMSSVSELGSIVVEGLTLIFNCNDENLSTLVNWATVLEDCSPSVALCICVITHDKDSSGNEIYKNKLVSWCTEHMIEYLEVSTLNQSCDVATSLMNDEETTGMTRVLEALTCNVWGTLELTNNNATNSNDYSLNSNTDNDISTASATVGLQNETDVHDTDKIPLSSTASNGKPSDFESSYFSKIMNDAIVGEVDTAEDDGEGNDNLDRAFQEIARVREASKNLSDQERREYAANAALRLMELLGLGSDEEDDEDCIRETQKK